MKYMLIVVLMMGMLHSGPGTLWTRYVPAKHAIKLGGPSPSSSKPHQSDSQSREV